MNIEWKIIYFNKGIKKTKSPIKISIIFDKYLKIKNYQNFIDVFLLNRKNIEFENNFLIESTKSNFYKNILNIEKI